MKIGFIVVMIISIICLAVSVYLYMDATNIVRETDRLNVGENATNILQNAAFHTKLASIFLLGISASIASCSSYLLINGCVNDIRDEFDNIIPDQEEKDKPKVDS